ncbi:MAG: serine/threonine-protein kinase [Cyanobacteria bacterium J06633_2]
MSVVSRSSAPARNIRDPKLAVPHIGSLVGGRYRVTCRLAEGTFGHTYLAKDTHLPNGPECVIKQLKMQTNEKAMMMARRLFETEARTLYKLGTHNQIPQLLAHFEQDDGFFLSQEYIDGYPISDELSPDRPWADVNVVRLIREILEVLVFVHAQQVIHRDIKPSNLIRRKKDGKVVLIDFGAVKEVTTRFLSPQKGETDYTIAIGTFGYIPKEQLGGRPRFSSDIFSVGMIAVQALTGLHPNDLLEDDNTAELQWRDRLIAPVNPGFANIIDRMIRYDFRERYANAEAALRAIESLPVTFREAASTPPWHVSSIRPPLAENSSLPPTDAFDSPVDLSEASTFGTASPQPPNRTTPNQLDQTHIETASNSSEQLEVLSDRSTLPISSTHMTDVVAPSFSKTPMESSHSHPPMDGSGAAYRNADFSSPVPPRKRIPRSATTWQEHVLVASDQFEDWLSRSWRMIALIGGTSLALMLTRGMVASFRVQPANQLRAEVVENVRSEAKQLLDGTQAEFETASVEQPAILSNDVSTVLEEAHQARIEGRYQEAMAFYQQALGRSPNHVDALWGKCATHNAQGQFEMASAACYEVLAINPEHPLALWSSAEANDRLGNHRKAAEERSRALTIDPNVFEKLSASSVD